MSIVQEDLCAYYPSDSTVCKIVVVTSFTATAVQGT